ncbi:RhoGAP domain containing protein [Acanthamoeba castellanii str. Neff]|uniref:RhoGAP domain containing protein n=1 Tax=Acanthamoeba castellanii (strain ATCC 30010 / Neff) TaxID=1257118 RepID=L8GXS7_ACACF|nr:RhoGAP domain containing protein [Acanthamoeba castellanii str. Neff]ELR17747.1 RhoGAP domain containing protein [Acanthamoeba castellanii str. Neff]
METTGPNNVQTEKRSLTTSATVAPASALKGLTSPVAASGETTSKIDAGAAPRGKRSKSGFVPRSGQKIKGSTVKKFLGVSTSSKDKPKEGSRIISRKLSVVEETGAGTPTEGRPTEKTQQIESFARRLESDLMYLQDIYAKLQNHTATTAQGTEDGKQLAKAFLEYSKQNGGEYGECLHAVAAFQVGMEETKLKLSNAVIEVFASPVKEFIDTTLPEALRSKDRYDEARLANIEADAKMSKQKPGKATITTQIEYNKAKYTYERTQEEAVNTLKDSIKEVSQDTLIHLCDYLDAYGQFFAQGQQMLSRLQPSIERYREYTQRQKDEDRQHKEEQERKEAEKREALVLEQKKYAEEGNTSLFGAPLHVLYEKEGISPPQVPSLYHVLIKYIREHGLKEVGLFRMAAAQNATAHIMKLILTASGRPIELEGELDPHAVAGVLKKLLRQLPEPLLTFELWDKFAVVITVVELCTEVTSHSAFNRMSPSGLGALLGPNLAYPAVSEDADLLRDMSVANLLVESLIQHYGKLFGDGSAACLSDCTGGARSKTVDHNLESESDDAGEELTDETTDDDERPRHNSISAGGGGATEDFASLYEREVVRGVGWSSNDASGDDTKSGSFIGSGMASGSGSGIGTKSTASRSVGADEAPTAHSASMEATSALFHLKESRGKSHARTHSGTKIAEASIPYDEDSPSPATGNSPYNRLSRQLTFTFGGNADDERRESKKKDGQKKDKHKKKEKKEKREKDSKKDNEEKKLVSLALKQATTPAATAKPEQQKLPSPRKRTKDTKEAKDATGKPGNDQQQPEKESPSPATTVQLQLPPKLAPMEVEMDIALKAFNVGQDADELVKEVAIDDLGTARCERPARVLLRRSLSGNIPSAAVSKRRGSTRGVEVKKRTSCLSTLTLYNEELLDKTIEEIFHTGSYSGWLVVGYKDSATLELQGSGVGGVDELVRHLKDTEVQFALLRLPIISQEDVDPSKSMISRDIFIGWIGPKVGIVQKGRKKAHVGEVKELLKPFHAELFALRRTNFTESVVRDKSGPISGSHMID